MMRWVAVLGAVGFSLAAAAQGKYSPAFDACVEKSEGITYEINKCNNKELALQNTRLNASYKAAMGALSDEKKTQLRDAQRLWVKYRDAHCFMYYHFSGGTMDQINGAGCELTMTLERTEALKWFAETGE